MQYVQRRVAPSLYVIACLLFACVVGQASGASVEFSYFQGSRTVGIDSYVLGTDTLLVDFEHLPSGDALVHSTVVDTVFEPIGLRMHAIVTSGAHAGEVTSTQAIDYTVAPNGGSQPAVSLPNILSGVICCKPLLHV